MIDKDANKNSFLFYVTFFVAPFFCLLPWLYYQYRTSISDNVSWNLTCAQRALSLATPWLEACYDTNPPLSAIIYIPAVLMGKFLPIPLYHCIFFFTVVLIIMCVFVTQKILEKLDFLSKTDRAFFTVAFAIVLTIITKNLNFADREHFIAAAIVPFCLCQLCLTKKNNLSGWILYPVLILGAVLLLVKPHFGLLPLSILAHRAITQRRLSVVFDKDFITLTAATLIYLIIILVFFFDFITVLLPDILAFYLYNTDRGSVFYRAQVYGIPAVFALIAFVLKSKRSEKDNFICFLLLMGILCLIALILQMKGFYYHLLPMFAFFMPALMLLALKAISPLQQKMSNLSKDIFNLATCLLAFGISYIIFPSFYGLPTHKDYMNARLTNYIHENCEEPCSFLITGENMGVVIQTAFYSGAEYASRFPSLWFSLPFIGDKRFPQSILDKRDIYQRRIAAYMVDDIERYNPSLLMILNETRLQDKYENFDYLAFMAIDPRANKIMKNYEKVDFFTEDRGNYFKGTLSEKEYLLDWDVYKRINPSETIK